MIDSAEQKSSASVPSTTGFRIMVAIALVLFVAAVFFIRSNSYRSAVADRTNEAPVPQVSQAGEEPQSDTSHAVSDSEDTMPGSNAPVEDVTGQAPSDEQAAATLPPPSGMTDERGGMGYNDLGMQPPPPPMGEMMMPLEVVPADPNAIQPHMTGPAFPAGQPMQPMMGYGYGPSGPYYWFIVPVPQAPEHGRPAVPGAAEPDGYDQPPAFDPKPETEEYSRPEEY